MAELPYTLTNPLTRPEQARAETTATPRKTAKGAAPGPYDAALALGEELLRTPAASAAGPRASAPSTPRTA